MGLGDVDTDINFGLFIDDNFDGTTSATALATLTNPWAQLVNPINPAASPLALFNVADGNPGVDTPGIDILMETNIPGALEGDPTPLQNDDFGGRQFLYPVVVPQAPSLLLMGSGLAAVSHVVRRRARRRRISRLQAHSRFNSAQPASGSRPAPRAHRYEGTDAQGDRTRPAQKGEQPLGPKHRVRATPSGLPTVAVFACLPSSWRTGSDSP